MPFIIIAFMTCYHVLSPGSDGIKAFPSADGFGKYATGGRDPGASVYLVTNLNDSGPGSLRAALTASGKRYVVPAVSGIIHLSSDINVFNSDVTILGQLAPYPGITIAGAGIRFQEMENFVMRFIRIRVGDARAGASNVRSLTVRECKLGIVDHCSMSWGMDEVISMHPSGGDDWRTEGITFQWNNLSEPLNLVKGGIETDPHGFIALLDGNNVSFHHNLLCHSASRNPQWFDRSQTTSFPSSMKGLIDWRNNLIYNYMYPMRGTIIDVNIVNNLYITGPRGNKITSSRNRFYHRPDISPVPGEENRKIHALGNKLLYSYNMVQSEDGYSESWDNNILGIRQQNGDMVEESKFQKFPHPIPKDVYEFEYDCYESAKNILAYSGMSLYKDIHDSRYVREILSNTYTYSGSNGSSDGIIDSQRDVGGWWDPIPETGDHDVDGISISWKLSKGLPVGVNVANYYDLDPNYPNLEVYANEIVADYIYSPTTAAVQP